MLFINDGFILSRGKLHTGRIQEKEQIQQEKEALKYDWSGLGYYPSPLLETLLKEVSLEAGHLKTVRKTDVRKEGPGNPSDGIQTWQLELMNHDPWSCFSTFLQPPLHGLHKSTRAYFTEHICSKFPEEKLTFRSHFLFLHHFSVIYKEYLIAMHLLFYLFSQQSIRIGRFFLQ